MEINEATAYRKNANIGSSIGDGGFDAFLRNCAQTKPSLYYVFVEWSIGWFIEWFLYFVLTLENYMIQKMENYMIQKNGKLYDSTN